MTFAAVLGFAAGAYEIENVDVDVCAVYTNKVPPGAFRGFGSPQVLFAVESMLDDIAFQMGFDPMEFRGKLLPVLRVHMWHRLKPLKLCSGECLEALFTLLVRKVNGR